METDFKINDRVHDYEGDTGTVVGFEDGKVLVDGDASGSSRPWRYEPRELIHEYSAERQQEEQLRSLNAYLAAHESTDEPLPESRRIEGLDDEVVRAAEELGLI